MQIDIDIIVYAVVALFIFWRLWSILGTRNEDEIERPNPFTPPAPKPAPTDASFNGQLPPLLLPAGPPAASLAGGLAQVKAIDPAFDEKQFLQQARETFTAIVQAYASGAFDEVTPLLSPALLQGFQQAAEARKNEGQTAQTRVFRIKEAEAVAARAEEKQAFITVRFVSDQENILRDARGTIIGGTEGKAEEVTDVWVFSRDTQTPDAKWVVVETRG